MKNKRIIKGNFDFQKIISKQQFNKNGSFVIYFDKSEKGFLEYGISVGKKIGCAVVRNKVKRQIRMMINTILKEGFDSNKKIIIIARQAMLNKSFDTNLKLLEQILKNR